MSRYLFHGSDVVVKNPIARINKGKSRDFSTGFYCTSIFSQAKQWALTKAISGHGIVNKYSYTPQYGLQIKRFNDMNVEEWLDFIVECRDGKAHDFDIVEGPVGDDKFWRFIKRYKDGSITKAEMLRQAVYSNAETHQICFCSEKAVKCLHFVTFQEVK